jgi:DNA uptake protein ComE-like DNA-binding protein
VVEETVEVEVVEVPEASDPMPDPERKHYDDILKLNVLVEDAATEHDIKKSQAKAAKEHLEGLQCRLSRLISEGPQKPDPQKELPFEEAWKQTPIEQAIEVTEKQLEKLHEAGIKTVIEFETERGGNRFASVKGIGEKALEKWEDQILAWMGVNAREEATNDPEAE